MAHPTKILVGHGPPFSAPPPHYSVTVLRTVHVPAEPKWYSVTIGWVRRFSQDFRMGGWFHLQFWKTESPFFRSYIVSILWLTSTIFPPPTHISRHTLVIYLLNLLIGHLHQIVHSNFRNFFIPVDFCVSASKILKQCSSFHACSCFTQSLKTFLFSQYNF